MAAWQVGAHTVVTAGGGVSTLVDIHTASSNVARVIGPARLTLTEGLLVLSLAEGVL